MVTIFYIVALCVATSAGLPVTHQYSKSDQMDEMNPLEYYYPHPEVNNYYQAQQANTPNAAPARLETLEPDSEVELIPGAQPPQQPPQQVPVSPNVPGLIPGQRVFIVNMPVPGLRPGSIGGYQPVYIVGAAPQGSPAYPNGYQNTLLLGPQVFNYPAAPANPNYVFGVPGSGPYVAYQDPSLYQQVQAPQGGPNLRLAQLVTLQGSRPVIVGASAASEAKSQDNESKEEVTENRNKHQKSPRAGTKANI